MRTKPLIFAASVFTALLGQMVIVPSNSGSSGGGSGAPTDATYITASADGTLSAEQVLGTTVISSAAIASRPAAASAGRLFFPTDGAAVYRDTGSAWVGFGPAMPFTDPTLKSWSWVNQNGSTVTTSAGSITITNSTTNALDACGTNECLSMRVTALPSAPYTIIAGVYLGFIPADYSSAGICLRDSNTGKFVVNRYFGVNYYKARASYAKFDSPTAINGNYGEGNDGPPPGFVYLAFKDNGAGTRSVGYSFDGQNIVFFLPQAADNFMTPDQAGFFVGQANGTHGTSFIRLMSWRETS